MIDLESALAQMQILDKQKNFVPFSIEFVKYDEARDTGGELVRIEKCVLVDTTKSLAKQVSPGTTKKPQRFSNKWQRGVRMYKQLGTDQIKSFHIWLITKFNDQPVVWNIHG